MARATSWWLLFRTWFPRLNPDRRTGPRSRLLLEQLGERTLPSGLSAAGNADSLATRIGNTIVRAPEGTRTVLTADTGAVLMMLDSLPGKLAECYGRVQLTYEVPSGADSSAALGALNRLEQELAGYGVHAQLAVEAMSGAGAEFGLVFESGDERLSVLFQPAPGDFPDPASGGGAGVTPGANGLTDWSGQLLITRRNPGGERSVDVYLTGSTGGEGDFSGSELSLGEQVVLAFLTKYRVEQGGVSRGENVGAGPVDLAPPDPGWSDVRAADVSLRDAAGGPAFGGSDDPAFRDDQLSADAATEVPAGNWPELLAGFDPSLPSPRVELGPLEDGSALVASLVPRVPADSAYASPPGVEAERVPIGCPVGLGGAPGSDTPSPVPPRDDKGSPSESFPAPPPSAEPPQIDPTPGPPSEDPGRP